MAMSLVLKKLHIDKKDFVTSEELKRYCRSMKVEYESLVRYFEKMGYLIRIFRGIFYVKSAEEIELGRSKFNHIELVARGMDLKKVKNWYFGLHTALKLNNITHEHFAVEEVVSDSIFRAKPMSIAGYKFRFTKLSPGLFGFGVVESKNGLKYSSPEKTILDFIYVWRYNGVPEDKIAIDVSEWTKGASKKQLKAYSKNYPLTVAKILDRVVSS